MDSESLPRDSEEHYHFAESIQKIYGQTRLNQGKTEQVPDSRTLGSWECKSDGVLTAVWQSSEQVICLKDGLAQNFDALLY